MNPKGSSSDREASGRLPARARRCMWCVTHRIIAHDSGVQPQIVTFQATSPRNVNESCPAVARVPFNAAGTVVGGTWGTTTRDRHGFGNQVRISRADGYATRYAHLNEAPLVRLGDYVAAGQLIGFMGGSQRGNLNALARHLHFEVTKYRSHIDPASFLNGASASVPATSAAVPLASPLYETRLRGDGSYASHPTGVTVSSSVYAAMAMGGDSAEIMLSAGGTLKRIAVVDGVWAKIDTLLPLNATSVSGVDTGTGFPELLAVEDGELFHIVSIAEGWTKT